MTGQARPGADVCAYCGNGGRAVEPLPEVLPVVQWSGSEAVGVCGYCAERLREAAEFAEHCGHPVPVCLELHAGELHHALQASRGQPGADTRFRAVSARMGLGRRHGPNLFRQWCGCPSCVSFRGPDGWGGAFDPSPAGPFGPVPGSDDVASMPPVDLAQVEDNPPGWRRKLVATMNDAQRVIVPDTGEVIRADEYVARFPVRRSLPRVKITPLDALSRLAELAIPTGPRYGNRAAADFQLQRSLANPDADWSQMTAEQPLPASVEDRSERCALCSAPSGLPPGAHGEARPLVVLCHVCRRDLDEALAAPQGWRFITQPGHGLESHIGQTRMCAAPTRDGEEVFDLATVNPGYRPLVLSILPRTLLARDFGGKVKTVGEWIDRLLSKRRSARGGR